MAGFNLTHHYEIDEWCCKVLHQNFPRSTVIQEDIKLVTNIPTASLLLSSPPCQGWSNAGNGKGEDDPRNLWPDMLRLVQQSRPRCVLVENVRGGVAKGYIDLVCGGLEDSGYEAQALVYPAAVVGAPHGRERVFIVAHTRHSDRLQTMPSKNPVTTSTGSIRHENAQGIQSFMRLSQVIQMWPTTAARDYTNPSKPTDGRIQRKLEQGWTIDLNDRVQFFSPQGYSNPQWWEAMMGLPRDWTKLDVSQGFQTTWAYRNMLTNRRGQSQRKSRTTKSVSQRAVMLSCGKRHIH